MLPLAGSSRALAAPLAGRGRSWRWRPPRRRRRRSRARGAAHLRPGQGRRAPRSTGARTATPPPGGSRCRAATRRRASQPWTGGDNGGATAPGVTKDTITVALYQAQPDLLQQAFFEQTGSDESLANERDTTQEYVDYFSAHYELYGRKVKLVPVKASGAPDDDVAAKADAIKVATEVHAFASFGGPGQTTVYADELAARGVLCVGDCVIAEPQSFLDQHAPYVWPTTASPEQASEHWAAFVGTQLARKKAVHAGVAGPDVEGAPVRRRPLRRRRGHVREERAALRAAARRRTR